MFLLFFFSLLEFLFKPWFRPKSFSSAKVAYIHQRATFLFRMSLINATRKYSIYWLLDEVQCLNKWKLMYVRLCVYIYIYIYMCVCVCNGDTSPISSPKAEDKLEMIHWNVRQSICDIKGTVMQIKKALKNNIFCVSKVSWKCCIPTIYNFTVIYPWRLPIS